MSSKIIYEEKYTDDVMNMLIKNKYWVFADGMRPMDIAKNKSVIDKRFVKKNGGLQITCLKDDKDFASLKLNPRAELRLENFKLKIGKRYKATIKINFPHANPGFEFLQIMVSGPSRPICQFEVRKNKLGARHTDGANGKGLWPVPIMDVEVNKDMLFEIDFCIDPKNGWITVTKDGKPFWSKKGATVFGGTDHGWFQYGVYKNGTGTSNDNSVIYKYFKIEEMSSAREVKRGLLEEESKYDEEDYGCQWELENENQ